MNTNNPFTAIIKGAEEGIIIHKDDNQRFALIENAHPEAAVHWLAVTYEEGTTEELEVTATDFWISSTMPSIPLKPRLKRILSYNRVSQ
jgi:hypothetical protein